MDDHGLFLYFNHLHTHEIFLLGTRLFLASLLVHTVNVYVLCAETMLTPREQERNDEDGPGRTA